MSCVNCESKYTNVFVPCKIRLNNTCVSCRGPNQTSLNTPFCGACAHKGTHIQTLHTAIVRYIYISGEHAFMCDHDTATDYVNTAIKVTTVGEDCESGVWFKPLCATAWEQRGLNHLD